MRGYRFRHSFAALSWSGVGILRIIDRDYVEPSNLQRQVLFDEADAVDSLPKAIAAARKIKAFNSEIVVEPHAADLRPPTRRNYLAMLTSSSTVLTISKPVT